MNDSPMDVEQKIKELATTILALNNRYKALQGQVDVLLNHLDGLTTATTMMFELLLSRFPSQMEAIAAIISDGLKGTDVTNATCLKILQHFEDIARNPSQSFPKRKPPILRLVPSLPSDDPSLPQDQDQNG